jgi:hypothetical protein
MRFMLVMLLLWIPPGQPAEDDPPERHVWAYYLGFWAGPESWAFSADFLDDEPLIGLYNSKLPEVAAAHIAQAQSAGITGFWVNWWGLDEAVTTTPALLNLLDHAAEADFEIAVSVDLYPEQFNRDYDQLVASVRYVVDELTTHPAYLHYDGKPLITFAFQYRADYTPAQWQNLREAVDPNRETIWLAEGLNACCLYSGAMDGMYAFNMAWADGEGDYYIAERNLIHTRGGAYYCRNEAVAWNDIAL